MKKIAFVLSSLMILTPALAKADYTLEKSGIERLPHYAQQHYTPSSKSSLPSPPSPTESPVRPFETNAYTGSEFEESETTPEMPQVVTNKTPVNAEGYIEIPYSSQDGIIQIDASAADIAPTIYGYSEDGLPITDFSNKVNSSKAQFIEQNPHLFKNTRPKN